ncbi:MAG: Ca-activated chloride channel family protein, partial [Flavobacteriales bacterium]
MNGVTFTRYTAEQDKRSPFERLKEIFFELLTHTSGDIDEAMDWMEQLDKEHGLTDD